MPSVAEILSIVEYLIKSWGIFIVPIGAFLENSVILGFLFPGVTIIFLSGFVTRTTGESIWLVVVLATIGSFLGDNLDYFIGRRAGKILEEKPLFADNVDHHFFTKRASIVRVIVIAENMLIRTPKRSVRANPRTKLEVA